MKLSREYREIIKDPIIANQLLFILDHFLNEDCYMDDFDTVQEEIVIYQLHKDGLLFITDEARILLTSLGKNLCFYLNSVLF